MYASQNMKDVDDWLRRISTHVDDFEWLTRNSETIHRMLYSACNHTNYRAEAVNIIARIYPWMLNLPDISRWIGLLNEALRAAMDRDMGNQQMEMWKALGLGHLFTGKGVAAEFAYLRLFEKAQNKKQRPLMLVALVGLIKAQMYTLSDRFTDEHVHMALELAHEFGNDPVTAELYQALSFAYVYRGEHLHGIEYGQMALLLWLKLDVSQEVAQAAYTLAVSYRMLRRWSSALKWIEFSKRYYSETDSPRQHVLITAEQANIYMAMELFETAKQWYTMMVTEVERLPPRLQLPQYIAGAHRGIALALIEQDDLPGALPHLWKAIYQWQQIQKMSFDLAANYATIGYVEMRQRHARLAYRYLDRALRMCRRLPETPRRMDLEGQIWQNLSSIYLKTNPPA